MATKTVVLRIEEEDFERLKARARVLGVRPGTAARIILKRDLAEGGTDREAGEKKRRALDALDRLRELRKDLPPVSAVELVDEERKELEERVPRALGWIE